MDAAAALCLRNLAPAPPLQPRRLPATPTSSPSAAGPAPPPAESLADAPPIEPKAARPLNLSGRPQADVEDAAGQATRGTSPPALPRPRSCAAFTAALRVEMSSGIATSTTARLLLEAARQARRRRVRGSVWLSRFGCT